MKSSIYKRTFMLALVSLALSGNSVLAAVSPFLQHAYDGALSFSANNRTGYLDYGSPGLVSVNKPFIWLTGLQLGKRIAFSDHVRISLGGEISIGNSAEDTTENAQPLDNGDTVRLVLQNYYIQGALLPELQVPFAVSPDASIFIRAGAGLHFMNIREQENILGEPDLRVLDPYLEDHNCWSISGHAGAGFEFEINNVIGFAFTYTFRYWNPVSFDYSRDLYPYKTIPYHERFITNSFEIHILLHKS